MFKCSVKIDEKLQNEVNEKMWIVSLISTIVGAIGLGAYIILATFFDNLLLEILLWVMAFSFGFGITYMITIKRINKKSVSNDATDELEIFEEYVNLTTIKNNEVIVSLKTYYKDLYKIRETKNYLLLYINKSSALAIPKQAFTTEEYSTIKLWVNQAKFKNTSNG